MSADTPTAICKSMGLALIGYGESLQRLKPDILVLLGDRFETFCMAAAAQVCRVPIAHIHGGETTEGAIDEAFRHSITKMSHLHFASCEEYRNRSIQLGEGPDRVLKIVKRIPLPELVARISNHLETDKNEVLCGNRKEKNCEARALISFFAAKEMGYRFSDIAETLGIHPVTAGWCAEKGNKLVDNDDGIWDILEKRS